MFPWGVVERIKWEQRTTPPELIPERVCESCKASVTHVVDVGIFVDATAGTGAGEKRDAIHVASWPPVCIGIPPVALPYAFSMRCRPPSAPTLPVITYKLTVPQLLSSLHNLSCNGKPKSIRSGSPQGTLTGPLLLFSIYFNLTFLK